MHPVAPGRNFPAYCDENGASGLINGIEKYLSGESDDIPDNIDDVINDPNLILTLGPGIARLINSSNDRRRVKKIQKKLKKTQLFLNILNHIRDSVTNVVKKAAAVLKNVRITVLPNLLN